MRDDDDSAPLLDGIDAGFNLLGGNGIEAGRQDDNQYRAYLLEEALQTVEHIALLAHVELQARHRALQGGLSRGLYLLAVERLDDGDAFDDAKDALTDGLMTAEDAATSALHAPGLYIGDIEIDGNNTESHQTDVDIGCEHQHQRQEGTGEERQNFDEEVVDGVRQAHDAAVDTRLQLARLVAIGREEGHSERQHTLDDTQRKVAADEDAHTLAIVTLTEGDEGTHHLLAQQDDADNHEDTGSTAPGKAAWRLDEGVDAVDGTVEHNGIDLRHQRTYQRQHQRDSYEPPVMQHVGQDIA